MELVAPRRFLWNEQSAYFKFRQQTPSFFFVIVRVIPIFSFEPTRTLLIKKSEYHKLWSPLSETNVSIHIRIFCFWDALKAILTCGDWWRKFEPMFKLYEDKPLPKFSISLIITLKLKLTKRKFCYLFGKMQIYWRKLNYHEKIVLSTWSYTAINMTHKTVKQMYRIVNSVISIMSTPC